MKISGITTDPVDPAVWGGVQVKEGQEFLVFFAEQKHEVWCQQMHFLGAKML